MSRTISLGMLESIRIASPCHADWDSMSGNDQVRFCSDCRLNVYNLSAMTQAEAESLVLRTEGRLCARFYRRADGTVLTRDCPVGLRALRYKATAGLARFAAAIAAILGSGIALGAGRSGWTARLRQIEPFSSICEWISPAPLPPAIKGQVIMMGAVAEPTPLSNVTTSKGSTP